jgi:hypothetical protein
MVATDTAKTVLSVLFGLSIIWIIVIIVKNDMQTIIRAIVVAALLGLGLYYVGQTKLETLSYEGIRNELFPIKAQAFTFARQDTTNAGRAVTTFTFPDPGPTLAVTMMSGGKYMAIKDIRTVNVVLEYLGLPPVAEGVSELAATTGRRLDADKFVWDDYERGVLVLERGICRDMASAQTFTCIVRITVTAR